MEGAPRGMALAAVLLAASSLAADRPVFDSEADLTWKYRVLLVAGTVGGTVTGTEAGGQHAVLTHATPAIEERDLLWFVFQGDAMFTNSPRAVAPGLSKVLRSRLGASRSDVVLIGKDGGVKLTSDALDLPSIFARIDAMPMRQREIRQ